MIQRRNACLALLAALLMVLWAAPVVEAQAAANATGTWKWTQQGFGRRGGGGGGGGAPGGGAPATQPGARAGGDRGGAPGGGGGGGGGRRGGAPTEITLNLKQDGEKLTGSVLGMNFQDPAAAIEIKEGTLKGSDVMFKVTRQGRGGEITTTYKGKIDGNTIKGTSETDFQGNPISAEWTATKS